MLASLLFAFPVILVACGAAAAPVIIHLMMRAKPRPVVFPAIRFVRKTHKANLSKLRLKQIMLLLMRMAIIVLIAMLIARGSISDWHSVEPAAQPTALAIVVDNSGSMGYLRDGKTLLERGKRMATQLISRLADNSRAAVISTAAPRNHAAFLSDGKVVAQQVWDIPATDGHFSLAAALAEAVSALQKCPLEPKQLCVITDLTAQAWRDRVQLAHVDNVRFVLLNCMSGEDTNMSLGPLHLSAAAVPVSAVVRLESDIHSSRVGGQVKLRVELDGREVTEQSHQVLPGTLAPVSATVSPRRAGVIHGRMILDYNDPLAMDNVRYFTLLAASPGKMLILRDPTTIGRGDRTTHLMSTAIAPTIGGGGRQWIKKVTISADRLAGSHLDDTDVVLVSNVSSLTTTQWNMLENYVYEGGRLWIVAGPLMSGPAYTTADAQRLMPLALEAQEALDGSMGWQWQWGQDVHPMLQPFATGENPPLSSVRCYRRMGAGKGPTAPGVQIILRYTDSVPAIATRKVGRGIVLFWNFSPQRTYSNLGGLKHYAILPILARRAARVLMGRAQLETMHVLGNSVTAPLPRGMTAAGVTLSKGAGAPQTLSPDLRQGNVTFVPPSVGSWDLVFARAGARMRRGFSVNTDYAESDMTPVEMSSLRDMFPPGLLTVADSLEDIQLPSAEVTASLDLAIPILLTLLALMIGESYFANRFYRRSPGDDGDERTAGL